jgi:ABC-type branched-subunit amino acid transport system ATPase component
MPDERSFKLEGVTKRFGRLTAVDAVTVALGEPGITGVVGPNGAGKTTLFNLITGQLRPTEGTIWLDGMDVTRRAPQDMARLGIGRSFQDVRLFTGMSVRDNVAVYAQEIATGRMSTTFLRPRWTIRARRAAAARADEVLERLGIDQLSGTAAEAISFAQQKLVAIARLLALEPRILFLDEPASGLDEPGRQTLATAIQRIADEGLAVCFVEHNTHLVRALSTRVLFVSEGRIMADGTADSVFSDPGLAEVYLGLA